jgi:tetratricopeptide (TPR) repeat protein
MDFTSNELDQLINSTYDLLTTGQFSKAVSASEDILENDPNNPDALYCKAFALRQLGRFAEAAQAVTSGLVVWQADSRLLNERALISYDQGDWRKAVDEFRQTLEADPSNPKALEWIVACYRMLRDFTAAQAEVNKALAKLPKNSALLNQRAFISYDQGDRRKALDEFRQTLEADPNNATALEWIVVCYRMLGDFTAAQAEVDKALAKLPKNSALLNQRAFISYDQGDRKKALDELRQTLEADPNNAEALEWIVVCYRMLRDFTAAQAEVDKALAKLPKNPALLNQRAFISYDQGDWRKALDELRQTLEADPSNPKALEWIVACYRMLRDFTAAQAEVDKALAKLPKNPALLNQRAFISYDQGDWKKALDEFQQVLHVDSKNETAMAHLITCYKKLGNAAAVKEAIQEASKTFVSSATVHYACGLAYVEDRSYADAEKAFALAAALTPNWHEPLFKLAEVFIRTGRQREAFTRMGDLKTKFPTNARIREALGFMYITARSFSSARAEFDAILAFDPGSEIANNGLAAVLFNTNRFKEAAEIFGNLASRNPHELVFRTNQARALSRMTGETELETAKEICEAVLRVDRVNSSAFACLGVIHFKLGNWNESEECLRKAIELSPGDGPYRDLGALYVKQARFDEAERELKVAMQIDPLDTQAYIEMGGLLFELGRNGDAIRILRRAVAIDRNSSEAVEALATGLIKLKELSEAEQQLRNGLKVLNPKDCFGIHLSLARLLIQLGSKANDTILLEEALQHATKAVKLEPHNPSSYFEMGMAHNALKSPGRALRMFKECRELAPDHLEAERNIERLSKLLTAERAVKRSDMAGIAISSLAVVLLFLLWALYLLQPLQAAPQVKTLAASVPSLIATRIDNKSGRAETATPEPQTSKPDLVIPHEPKIDKSMLLTFTPMLLGLIVIGAILPWVGRLKFAGMEAELQQARVSIGAGPSGQTGSSAPEGTVALSSSANSSINSGPR